MAKAMPKLLPDIIGPNLLVLFCGLNPGAQAAASGHHFVGRGNRFWRAMHLAGFTPHQIDPEQDRSLLNYGFGLTTVVARATSRADQLAKPEFIAAAAALQRKLVHYRPGYLAFLGKAAYAALSKEPKLPWGRQEQSFGGTAVWVLPNPSGLNRGFSLEALVDAYRDLRLALQARLHPKA